MGNVNRKPLLALHQLDPFWKTIGFGGMYLYLRIYVTTAYLRVSLAGGRNYLQSW